MGADLLIATMWIQQDRDPDWTKAQAAADAIHWGKDGEAFPDYAANCSIYDQILDFDGDDVAKEKALRESINDQLTLIREGIEKLGTQDGRRDLTTSQHGGWLVYITGESTWGDSPGELFDAICALDQLGVLKAAGFYDDTNAVVIKP